MANLAIKGHATRGKEVIEILEMLGGNRPKPIFDELPTHQIYYIRECDKAIVSATYTTYKDMFQVYTLEEFLKKYPYKVGDKVTLDNLNCEVISMSWDDYYNEIDYFVKGVDFYKNTYVEQLQPYKEQETMEEQIKIDIPKGYEFAGVDARQVVFEKVKPKCPYPKNYDECYNYILAHISFIEPEKIRLSVFALHKVIRCLHTYWAIDGEPDFNDYDNRKYTIINVGGVLMQSDTYDNVRTLTFKSEEARDAFYENFKDLIEQCKELL